MCDVPLTPAAVDPGAGSAISTPAARQQTIVNETSDDADGLSPTQLGGSPWAGPQKAFFVPYEHIEETWKWAKANRGYVDIIKHGNTGCMHDDHGLR